MYFCVPRSMDIYLKCLMLVDFIHGIIDISAYPSMSISTCRNHHWLFYNYLLLFALLHLQQSVCKLLASVFPPFEIGTI